MKLAGVHVKKPCNTTIFLFDKVRRFFRKVGFVKIDVLKRISERDSAEN